MKILAIYVSIFAFFSALICWGAQNNPPLNVRTIDGATTGYPYQLKVPNSSLTNNNDGTMTLTYSTGTASPSVLPFTLDPSNKWVGLNNTSPAEPFSIFSSTGEAIAYFNDNKVVQFGDIQCLGNCTQLEVNPFSNRVDFISGLTTFTGGNVGIGTASPTSKLDIVDSNSTTNVNRITQSVSVTDTGTIDDFTIRSKTISKSSGTFSGNFVSEGSNLNIFGDSSYPTYTGTINSGLTGNGLNLYGYYTNPIFTGTVGTNADAMALAGYAAVIDSNMGTTGSTTKYGVRSAISGTSDVSYAIYATASGATTNYGIYSAAGLNYFSGNVGIGDTTPSEALDISGNLQLQAAGNGIKIKEGSDATMGLSTLSSGTVVVSTTKVTASSRILLTAQTLGTITVPVGLAVSARTAGTSFTILSGNLTDTSTIAWLIVEPAP